MAKKAAAPRKRKMAADPPATASISVHVPHDTSIRVSDLKNCTDQEMRELLDKAAKSKVGFIILNAPFKVAATGPVD